MRRATINRLLVLAGIVVFAILFRALPVTDWLEQLARLNEQYPVAVPVAYVVAVTIATVALFPGWISMMLGGLLFGLLPGLPLHCSGLRRERSAHFSRDVRWDAHGSSSAWGTT